MTQASLFDLAGKVAIVIGGGSGIGEAVTLGCARARATVVCLDLNEPAASAVRDRARASSHTTDCGLLDIRDGAAVERAFDDVQERHGSLDIVVCTPSINVRKPILQYSDEEFDRVVALNMKGNFNVLRAAGRVMTAQGQGSIVLFSSIRSQVVEPGQAVYAATKAAIVQMVRTAAAEFGTAGVRVNAVAPGVIETPLTAPIKNNPGWYQAYADKTILKRWGTAEEMVGPTIFLASDAASYVTGTLLLADGGWTAADGRFTPPGM